MNLNSIYEALEYAEKLPMQNNMYLPIILYAKGNFFRSCKKFEEAIECFEKANSIFETSFLSNRPEFKTLFYHDYGLLLHKVGFSRKVGRVFKHSCF